MSDSFLCATRYVVLPGSVGLSTTSVKARSTDFLKASSSMLIRSLETTPACLCCGPCTSSSALINDLGSDLGVLTVQMVPRSAVIAQSRVRSTARSVLHR